ncbi:PTS sugar transporter subunit IIA [Tetragenococcus halophilus]|nr:PTS sugar transporter subunit IIA [Tetragenococcus halophilus]NWN99660.1 PTS sugar transporter subunit IIA [Tetragenococcus halophilus]
MYLNKKLFSEQVVLINQNASSQEKALRFVCSELEKTDAVTSDFFQAIIEREKVYPTGLSLSRNIGVAIPHTDPDKVKKSQIGFISLKNPVKFKQMGDASQEVKVTMIFVLCLKSSNDQLDMLQKLMQMFNDEDAMNKLIKIRKQEEFYQILE